MPAEPEIHEREEGGRYEAWAIVNGVLFSKVVRRSPIWGWPFDYKVKAHSEIRAAILARRC